MILKDTGIVNDHLHRSRQDVLIDRVFLSLVIGNIFLSLSNDLLFIVHLSCTGFFFILINDKFSRDLNCVNILFFRLLKPF